MTKELVLSDIQFGAIQVHGHSGLIAVATEVAKELAKIVEERKLYSNIKGKKFVRVEGWSTMGAMLGIVPREKITIEHDNGDFEATVELVRASDGVVVGQGSAIVGADEPTWSTRPRYAKRSMAQTRATGKAFRLGFSWIVSLAGYEVTPAEEMDGIIEGDYEDKKERKQPKEQKITRPFTPEQLMNAIYSGVKDKVDNGWNPKNKGEEDINMLTGLVASNLEKCFAGEGATDKRHTLLAWMFGSASLKTLRVEELVTLNRWLDATQDSGGEYVVNPLSIKEANTALVEALKDEGQIEMNLEENK